MYGWLTLRCILAELFPSCSRQRYWGTAAPASVPVPDPGLESVQNAILTCPTRLTGGWYLDCREFWILPCGLCISDALGFLPLIPSPLIALSKPPAEDAPELHIQSRSVEGDRPGPGVLFATEKNNQRQKSHSASEPHYFLA